MNTSSEFEKVRALKEDELAFKIMMPRKTKTSVCTNTLGDKEICGMRLADTVGIDGPVCPSCGILYRYVGDQREVQA